MAKARASRKSGGKVSKAGKAKRSGARRPKPARSAAKAARKPLARASKPLKASRVVPVVEIPETPPPLPQPIASFTF
jgi:hypothetical protein